MNNFLFRARLVYGSMIAGTTFFAVVIGVLYTRGAPSPLPDPVQSLSLLQTLSLMNVFFFIVTWSIGPVLQKQIKNQPVTAPAGLSSEETRRARWLNSRLMILAPREGSAFMGLTTCLLGVLNGALYSHPVFWANTLSALLMALYALFAFPRESDLSALDERSDSVPTVIR